MTFRDVDRRKESLRRLKRALLLTVPALLIGSTAAADSLSFSVNYGSGHPHKGHWHRKHHRHHFAPPPRIFHYHHVHRPPMVLYRTVLVDRPVVMPYAQSCTSGLWRQLDGAMVEGVACRQPDGSWRLEP